MEKGKQKIKPVQQIIQIVQGPPLDFSFKDMKLITQILLNTSTKQNIDNEESLKPELSLTHNSQKQTTQPQVQTRLNIIRTIDIQDMNNQANRTIANKKIQKTNNKIIKKKQQKISTLFLRYNKLKQIEGITDCLKQLTTNKWQNLAWIDLSHNRIISISKQLQQFAQLKTFYLHVNYISSFKQLQNLKQLSNLKTFTIHGNPLQKYQQFRCLISAILPQIQKLDSVLFTKRQRQKGQWLKNQIKDKNNKIKYPVIQNPPKPKEDSQQQEQS